MCPSERGPPTVTGLFSSSATKRAAAQNYDFVPGNKIVAKGLEYTAKVVEAMLVRFEQRLLRGVWIGPMEGIAAAHAAHGEEL